MKFWLPLCAYFCRWCGVVSAVEDADPVVLGIFGTFTSLTQYDLAAAVLFDLDFRKNQNISVRERFGPPIIELPDLHPDLRIKVQLGTSHSSKTYGLQTTMDWFLGVNGRERVAGIVGGLFSSVSDVVASMAEVYEVPQVAFGATMAAFSDKTLYPWFSRVSVPDSLQGQAIVEWMDFFAVHSMPFLYTNEGGTGYSEGLLQVALDIVNLAGQSGRITGIGISFTNDDERNMQLLLDANVKLRETKSKFICMVLTDSNHIAMSMNALEQDGMLYGSHQILATDSFSMFVFDSSNFRPSRGLPIGFQRFLPISRGPLYPKYLEMLSMMRPEDLYGAAAMAEYQIDKFRVPLVPALTLQDFLEPNPWSWSAFIVDAAYTFVFAINSLLHAGYNASEIYGRVLLDEIRRTSFEGITGFVSFSETADRIGNYHLWNALEEGGDLTAVAIWNFAFPKNFMFYNYSSAGVTWVDGSVGKSAPAALVACAPGQRWDEFAGLCIFCPVNLYSLGGVRSDAKCLSCEPGRVSAVPSGASECVDCRPGTFRTASGEVCSLCPAGKFTAAAGLSGCEDCPVGAYASVEGTDSCEVCGDGLATQALFTTMTQVVVHQNLTEYAYLQGATRPEQCGCDRGAREDANNECISCTEGMICRGMSDVTIERGYYAEAMDSTSKQISIFKCHGNTADVDRCKGGKAGDTCATGRTGVTCAECKDGMQPGDDGTCIACGASEAWPLFLVLLLWPASLGLLYHMLDRHSRQTMSHAFLLFSCVLGQMVTVTQQMGVLRMMTIQWEEPVRSILDLFALLTFNINILGVNCVSAQGPVVRFTMKLCIIFMTIAIMLLLHGLFVAIRHKWDYRSRMHVLVGAVGSLFMIFNISVTSTVLQPFQCQTHPNDKWTVSAYPAVICWESGEHASMLVIGGFAFLAVPVAYIAGCIAVVQRLPVQMRAGNTTFLNAFAFLFVRFRHTRHYYVLIHILKSFFIAVILVLPNIVLQLLALDTILLAGLCAVLYLWPWRVDQANVLDCFFGICVLLVTCITPFFLSDEEKDLRSIAWIASIMVIGMMVCALLVMAYTAHWKLGRNSKRYQFFLCHHKMGCGAYVRLLKMYLIESKMVSGDIFLDSDNLDNLDHLFEYVANDTRTLVVMCTPAIFTRPWCIGEMCVARLKKVLTIAVMFPDCEMPDQKFITDLETCMGTPEVLTECGISKEMIATTLAWVPSQPRILVPVRVSDSILKVLVEKLATTQRSSTGAWLSAVTNPTTANPNDVHVVADVATAPSAKVLNVDHKSISVYDRSNPEAAAAAFILKKLLVKHLSDAVDKIPEPLEADHSAVAKEVIVVICTQGAFDKSETVGALLSLATSKLQVLLPVISEQTFRFPPKDTLPTFTAMGYDVDDATRISDLVAALFKEIAINFIPQHHSSSHLNLEALDIAARVKGKVTTGSGSGTFRITPGKPSKAAPATMSTNEPLTPAGGGVTEIPSEPLEHSGSQKEDGLRPADWQVADI